MRIEQKPGTLADVPYGFPYEDLFVWAVGGLIVGLLLVRVRLARQRTRRSPGSNS